MKTLLSATLALSLLSGFLQAQEGDIPPKHLRIIALGEYPELKEAPLSPEGIRTFEDPPPGSFIPRPIFLKVGENQKPLSFALSQFSPMITLPGEVTEFQVRPDENRPPWIVQKAPSHPLSLGVLHRDPATMSWNDPKLVFLKDDAVSFPTKHVRFVNTTNKPVYFSIGKAALSKGQVDSRIVGQEIPAIFTVDPGKVILQPLKEGKNILWIGSDNQNPAENSRYATYWFNEIFLENDDRVNFFFYKSQMKKPRLPFLMHHKTEKIPRP